MDAELAGARVLCVFGLGRVFRGEPGEQAQCGVGRRAGFGGVDEQALATVRDEFHDLGVECQRADERVPEVADGRPALPHRVGRPEPGELLAVDGQLADEARRRIERDLHGGLQERLVSLLCGPRGPRPRLQLTGRT